MQNTDGAGKLYLLNASFLRGQIALVGLIKNVQKARRPQLLPLKRKEHQHSMMLSDTRKDRPFIFQPNTDSRSGSFDFICPGRYFCLQWVQQCPLPQHFCGFRFAVEAELSLDKSKSVSFQHFPIAVP